MSVTKINIKDAIFLKAWNEIKSDTINNCFTLAKLKITEKIQEVLESNELVFQEFHQIMNLIGLENFMK